MKNFRLIWKQLAKEKKLKPLHFIQRAALIASQSKRNLPQSEIATILLDKYFSPITNKNKLSNGRTKYDTVKALQNRAQEKFVPILDEMPDNFFDTPEEQKAYYTIINELRIDKIDRKYIYYFTAQDMSQEQQGVQAGHALFALGARLANHDDAHETYFQWIGVKDSSTLSWLANKYAHLNPEKFFEPDQGHRMTSFALPPIEWYARGDLVDHPLLTHSK